MQCVGHRTHVSFDSYKTPVIKSSDHRLLKKVSGKKKEKERDKLVNDKFVLTDTLLMQGLGLERKHSAHTYGNDFFHL